MKITTLVFMSILSSSIFAFDSVTEILPSGKILICRNADQVKKGNLVEVYKRTDPKSTSDYSTAKIAEFKLPEVGQRVKLTHRDFHSKGKKSLLHEDELGTAIVVGGSLEGEERISYELGKERSSKRIEKRSKLSKEEADKIQNDCLVALAENGLQLKEKAAVSWK